MCSRSDDLTNNTGTSRGNSDMCLTKINSQHLRGCNNSMAFRNMRQLYGVEKDATVSRRLKETDNFMVLKMMRQLRGNS